MTKLYLNTDKDWLLLNTSSDWLLLDDGSTDTYPTTPMWREVAYSSVSPTFVSVTHSLARQARSTGAHAWAIELAYGAVTRSEFGELWSFLVKQAGQYGAFYWSPSTPFVTLGTGGGAPYVQGAGQTGTTLSTDGWSNSETVMKAGDFFSIEGDTKVYQVTADVVSDGTGQATMEFFPSLRASPANLADIDVSPVFRVSLSNDTLTTDWSQCVHSVGFVVSLVEVR